MQEDIYEEDIYVSGSSTPEWKPKCLLTAYYIHILTLLSLQNAIYSQTSGKGQINMQKNSINAKREISNLRMDSEFARRWKGLTNTYLQDTQMQ